MGWRELLGREQLLKYLHNLGSKHTQQWKYVISVQGGNTHCKHCNNCAVYVQCVVRGLHTFVAYINSPIATKHYNDPTNSPRSTEYVSTTHTLTCLLHT